MNDSSNSPIQDTTTAFALRVVGDDLYPRIKSGDYVVVSPSHPCNPGDEVLVTTIEGTHRVWELLERRDGHVTLSSINDNGGRFTLNESGIQRMQYVAGFAKSALYRAATA